MASYFRFSGFHTSTESARMLAEFESGFGLDIRARGGREELLGRHFLHDLPVFEADVKHPCLFLSHEIYVPPAVRLVGHSGLVHFVQGGIG